MAGLAGPVRDALLTGLIVLVLALPIVGLRLVGLQGVLVIEPHLDNVAELAAAAMLGRFAFRGVRASWRQLPSIDFSALAGATAGLSPYAGWAAVAVAVALPFIGNTRWIDLGTTVLTYVMLGWGLNIVVGLAGLLDLGYVAFYGVGAYTMAILSTGFGFGFWECLPLAGLFAALFGIVLGIPVLRLRGDYLAIVTLGFGEIIRLVLLNWANLTNGPNGIGGIPAPTLFGIAFTRHAPRGMMSFADLVGIDYAPLQTKILLYGVILTLALATNLLALRLRRLPIGRAWEALREDEIACRALGIDPTRVKLSAFALGAMVGGLAGAFFAVHQSFVSPESFTFTESAMILAIVVLGGMGSQLGVALAAVAIAAAPELMRGFDQYRMMLFGAVMVALMVLRPQGLLTHRRPSVLLPRGKAS